MPGPIPKRSDERRRTNHKAETDRVSLALPVVEWPEPDPLWPAIARDWFRSLGESGQAVYYEPSDVQMARVGAEVLARLINQGQRMSSQLLASWLTLSNSLLTTEGDRRRVRLELERQGSTDEDEDASVTAINRYRDAVS
jgi:hypothetical protein